MVKIDKNLIQPEPTILLFQFVQLQLMEQHYRFSFVLPFVFFLLPSVAGRAAFEPEIFIFKNENGKKHK